MFDYQVSKHPHFDEACRAFALRHNLVQLAERAGMNVQILRNKLNPAQPHLLTAPEIWLLTDLTEDSTLVDGFLAQIHCLPCVPINEVAKEKLPHYVMSATAEIGRVAAGAVSGDVKTSAGRRDAISSINSVTRLMALAAVSLQARLQANPAMASAVDTVTGLGAFIRFAVRCLC
ncbi:phage regulatory CII family protein [Escherichia coli]|nr:phage regulatory CII family protein [Escherichia coli]QAZ83343.1 phage regulatory CII family protein [Escherichia coli]